MSPRRRQIRPEPEQPLLFSALTTNNSTPEKPLPTRAGSGGPSRPVAEIADSSTVTPPTPRRTSSHPPEPHAQPALPATHDSTTSHLSTDSSKPDVTQDLFDLPRQASAPISPPSGRMYKQRRLREGQPPIRSGVRADSRDSHILEHTSSRVLQDAAAASPPRFTHASLLELLAVLRSLDDRPTGAPEGTNAWVPSASRRRAHRPRPVRGTGAQMPAGGKGGAGEADSGTGSAPKQKADTE